MEPAIVEGMNGAYDTPVDVEYVYVTWLIVAVSCPLLIVYIGLVVQSFVIVPSADT